MLIEQFEQKENFREVERTIISYLKKNKEKVSSLTLNQLAKDTFSSNSSVLRFCKKLGFRGFKDFKIQLMKEFWYLPTESLDFNLPFSSEDSIEAIGNNLASVLTDGIQRTKDSIDLTQLEIAAYTIRKSHRVFLFGKGDSGICVENFKNKMVKLNQYFIVADEHQASSYTIGNITPDDAVLFCTYGGMHYDYVKHLSILKDKKVPVIVMTSNTESELSKGADILLQIPADESCDQKVATFASQMNMDFIFDYLYSILFQQNFMDNYRFKHKNEAYTNHILMKK